VVFLAGYGQRSGRPVRGRRGGRERVPEKEGVREKGEKQVFFSFFNEYK
jgi:hypothetical protein